MEKEVDYDSFLTKIYNYSPYFGQERAKRNFATPFYLSALKNIQSRVLEMGTCTGLLTIPLLKAGYEIDSIDISPYMHQYVKERLETNYYNMKERIRLYTCNVYDYVSICKYDGIVMPDSFLLAQAEKKNKKNYCLSVSHC